MNYIALFLLLLLVGCGGSRDIAGSGTASETTNGIVLSSAMAPVSNAHYRIVDIHHWSELITAGTSVILDSGKTDSTGAFDLSDYRGKVVGLHITDSDTTEGVWFEVAVDSTDTFYIKPLSLYTGKVLGSSVDSIRLAPTDMVVPVADDGTYRFPHIPAGLFPVMIVSDAEPKLLGSVELYENDSSENRAVPVDDSLLLIDDFERKDLFYTAQGITTKGRWYYFSDSDHGGTTFYSHRVVDDGSGSNKWIHSQVAFDDSIPFAYAGLGFTLGQDSDEHPGKSELFYDMRSLEAIEFDAKGAVILRIKVTTKARLNSGEQADQFSYTLRMNGEKERIVVPVDSLSVSDGTTWDSVADSVSRVSFSVNRANGEKAEFWIDNIYFRGDVRFE